MRFVKIMYNYGLDKMYNMISYIIEILERSIEGRQLTGIEVDEMSQKIPYCFI